VVLVGFETTTSEGFSTRAVGDCRECDEGVALRRDRVLPILAGGGINVFFVGSVFFAGSDGSII
jgi:hypothetical protein